MEKLKTDLQAETKSLRVGKIGRLAETEAKIQTENNLRKTGKISMKKNYGKGTK